ncbi:MAG TPA: hypothetical protein VGJ91_06385, partial [Polyangiaceae bacterium]
MRSLIPGKQTSLASAQTLVGPLDLVDAWKLHVRTTLARWAELNGAEPKLRVRVDARLVLFAALFGLAGGPFGTVRALVLLLSILLLHELSRGALARALGRSARVSISLAGGRTEISGPELHGGTAFAFTVVGSVANVALAGVLQLASRRVHDPALGRALDELGN